MCIRDRKKAETAVHLDALKIRWEKERDLVNKIREVRAKLEGETQPAPAVQAAAPAAAAAGATVFGAGASAAPVEQTAPPMDPEALRTELRALDSELEQLQGETPLMRICVDAHIVGDVVSAWTGIPIGRMLKDEVQAVLQLENVLGRRVIGQDHALGMIAERIRTSKAGMEAVSYTHLDVYKRQGLKSMKGCCPIRAVPSWDTDCCTRLRTNCGPGCLLH